MRARPEFWSSLKLARISSNVTLSLLLPKVAPVNAKPTALAGHS